VKKFGKFGGMGPLILNFGTSGSRVLQALRVRTWVDFTGCLDWI